MTEQDSKKIIPNDLKKLEYINEFEKNILAKIPPKRNTANQRNGHTCAPLLDSQITGNVFKNINENHIEISNSNKTFSLYNSYIAFCWLYSKDGNFSTNLILN